MMMLFRPLTGLAFPADVVPCHGVQWQLAASHCSASVDVCLSSERISKAPPSRRSRRLSHPASGNEATRAHAQPRPEVDRQRPARSEEVWTRREERRVAERPSSSSSSWLLEMRPAADGGQISVTGLMSSVVLAVRSWTEQSVGLDAGAARGYSRDWVVGPPLR